MSDFYEDHKFCERCEAYVRYLRSPQRSFCVRCGAPVRLFSDPDHRAFRMSLARERSFDERPAGERGVS